MSVRANNFNLNNPLHGVFADGARVHLVVAPPDVANPGIYTGTVSFPATTRVIGVAGLARGVYGVSL